MVAFRLRHPGGSATLQIPLEDEAYTVQDLQQEIYKTTNILPSRQILKAGYPPRAITIVPELPLSSLGLRSGEPIIVNENAGASAPAASATSSSTTSSTRAVSGRDAGQAPSRQQSRNLDSASAGQSTPPAPSRSSGPDHVATDGGILIHRVVPDDNSCLFSSVALIFAQDMNKAQEMRKIVADGIKGNPELYNEAILGMPPDKYISTITKSSSWGGAIELGILAAHYGTEISSIDVETGRVDHFTPPEGDVAENRCLLIYSGIHYDAITLAPMLEAPAEWHQTVFPRIPEDLDPIMPAAKKLADILRSKKAFTNTATFDLKCEDCGQGLKGEKDARAHAAQTGHLRFGEYTT